MGFWDRRARIRFIRSYRRVLDTRNGDARGLAFHLNQALPGLPGNALGVYASGVYPLTEPELLSAVERGMGFWFFVRDGERNRLHRVFVIDEGAGDDEVFVPSGVEVEL